MRSTDCHFRYHPRASEDFLILPSSLFLISRPRRGRLALGLPRFGSSFGSVIPRERPITFQLAFQDNRLMFFENQSRLEFLLAPLSIFNCSRSSMTGLNRASEPFTISLKM